MLLVGVEGRGGRTDQERCNFAPPPHPLLLSPHGPNPGRFKPNIGLEMKGVQNHDPTLEGHFRMCLFFLLVVARHDVG